MGHNSSEDKEYWHWRQDTPMMQFALISNSIEGWISNIKDRPECIDRANKNLTRHAAELVALAPYLKQGHW